MRVLIGCEYSGIVRDAFKKAGHESWSCDLLPTESPGKHFQQDILKVLCRSVRGDWDMIGLHLPCTAIASSGNWVYAEGKDKWMMRVQAINWTKLVIDCAMDICDKVYFENPKNCMGKFIGRRTQVLQPYEYGHLEKKETWLWLWGLPKLYATKNVYQDMLHLPLKEINKIYFKNPSKANPDRGKERSLTYPGIAEAMADQWA